MQNKGRVYLELQEVREMLEGMLQKHGAAAELARAGGMPTCSIYNVRAGREYPGEKLLRAMGLRRVVLYEVVGQPIEIPEKRKRVVKPTLLTISTPPPGAARIIHRMDD